MSRLGRSIPIKTRAEVEQESIFCTKQESKQSSYLPYQVIQNKISSKTGMYEQESINLLKSEVTSGAGDKILEPGVK